MNSSGENDGLSPGMAGSSAKQDARAEPRRKYKLRHPPRSLALFLLWSIISVALRAPRLTKSASSIESKKKCMKY